jgi:hypothetical protein
VHEHFPDKYWPMAALVQLADKPEPSLRWPAGADAVDGLEQKARVLLAQTNAHREVSVSLGHDDE